MCTSHSTITNNTERLRPNTTELKKNNLHLTYPIQIHPAKPHEYLTNKPRCSSKLKQKNFQTFSTSSKISLLRKFFPPPLGNIHPRTRNLSFAPARRIAEWKFRVRPGGNGRWTHEKDPGALSD